MSQATALEQYFLELVNAERATAGVQPLAFDGDLNESSDAHSSWMLNADVFSHTGQNGSSAGDRMKSAGYTFSGSWTWGENIAWVSQRGEPGLNDEVRLLHTNLMNSPGHRANLLKADFREIGIGLQTGDFQGWNAAMVTQNFAKTGTALFVTGVAFDDQDGDRAYDPGEGLGGLTVTARNTATGAVTTGATGAAGGYDLALGSGTYDVTFSGGGFTTTTRTVTVGSQNVKVDLVDPAVGGTTPTPPPPPTGDPVATKTGTAGADYLTGTAGADLIRGLDGADRLLGRDGDDRLEGGNGNDVMTGGAGRDTLVGGAGQDKFVLNAQPTTGVDVILDFNVADDTIQLDNAVFTAFGWRTGGLSVDAFRLGTAAQDATDRVIYDSGTGALFYDADGSGGGAAVKIAELPTGLALTASDFAII